MRRAQWSNRIFSHVLGRPQPHPDPMRFRNHGLLVERRSGLRPGARLGEPDGGPRCWSPSAPAWKLPLGTTYVWFMVTSMGASLAADRAWGPTAPSTAWPVCWNVIGWLALTAVGAFVASGFVALLIHYGGIWTAVVLFPVAMVFLYLSHRPRHTHPLVRAGRRR